MYYPKPEITYFAETSYWGKQVLFGIKQEDRLLHTYIVGKTGTGKTNLLQTQIIQDLDFSRGLCVLDIHGDLITNILAKVPQKRRKDIIYLDITDTHHGYKFNPFISVPFEKRALISSGILDVFQKIWKSAWGLKMEHILRYIILTLLDQKEANFSDILRIIDDENYRIECVKNIVDETIKRFWLKEFDQYSKNDILPILNKVGTFLAYPAIKRLLVDDGKEISFRDIMDKEKILLINLSKGALGEDVSYFLGSLLLNSISFSAFSRIDIEERKRAPFFVYLDEFQNYTTPSLVNMLSELRKFKLGLIMANQYLSQLTEEIRDAVLGNVGTLIVFRLGVADATYLSKEFYPVFETIDLINLSNYEICLKLMIDGKPAEPFNAKTIKWFE